MIMHIILIREHAVRVALVGGGSVRPEQEYGRQKDTIRDGSPFLKAGLENIGGGRENV